MLTLIGLGGFIINRKSVFTILLALELILIGTIKIYLLNNDIYITMIIVMIAGIESLVGLALLVNYYKW